MPVNKEYLHRLVLDEILGTLTPENSIILKKLLNNDSAAVALREKLYTKLNTPEAKAALEKMNKNLTIERLWEKIEEREQEGAIRKKNRLRIISMAVITVAAIASGYMGVKVQLTAPQLYPTPVQSERPAISVLRAGKQEVKLINQQHLTISGVTFRKDTNRLTYLYGKSKELFTLDVAPGKNYIVQLADKSEITLNAISTLQFTAPFTGYCRQIAIDGEAYLKVTQNARQPFVLYLADQKTVQVLGTTFNVNTFNKDIHVALLEGKIEVHDPKSSLTLKPGEAITATSGTTMQVTTFNPDNIIEWIHGRYTNDRASINELHDAILRIYGVDVVIDDTIQANRKCLHLSLERDISLENVLEAVQLTGHFNYFTDDLGRIHIKYIP